MPRLPFRRAPEPPPAPASPARRRSGSTSGRTTPAGTTPGRPRPSSGERTGAAGRYTPPTPKLERPSPPWVPALMFALLLAGALVIVLNYLGVLPTESGEASNWWLLAGLGLISAGFVTATQYR